MHFDERFSAQQTSEALVTLVAGFLVFKMQVLWSESRMLRKLRARSAEQVAVITSASDEMQNFSQIYAHFAKGRHRRISRVYQSLFYLFLFSFDTLVQQDQLDPSDGGIMALRSVLYSGLFSVWGARPFSLRESLLLVSCVIFHLCVTSVFLAGVVGDGIAVARFAYTVRVLRLAVFLLFAGVDLFKLCVSFRGDGTHVSEISYAIQKARLRSESRQDCRLRWMVSMCENAENSRRGTKAGPYWGLNASSILQICALSFEFLTNGIAWGPSPVSAIPPVLLLEAFELVATVLILVNDTQVEPTLFAHMLKIAGMSAIAQKVAGPEEYERVEIGGEVRGGGQQLAQW